MRGNLYNCPRYYSCYICKILSIHAGKAIKACWTSSPSLARGSRRQLWLGTDLKRGALATYVAGGKTFDSRYIGRATLTSQLLYSCPICIGKHCACKHLLLWPSALEWRTRGWMRVPGPRNSINGTIVMAVAGVTSHWSVLLDQRRWMQVWLM